MEIDKFLFTRKTKHKLYGKIKMVQIIFDSGVVVSFNESVLLDEFKKNIDVYVN